MSWKDVFKKAISSFQADDLESSLTYFNKAIELDGTQYVVYDSRAAVYDKLGRPNDALRDAKKVIDIAPAQWQGYARSSRVFLKARKYDAALQMIDLALGRLKADDATRHAELASLRDQALHMRAAAMELERQQASKVAYHFGMLPLELCVVIFQEITLSDPGQVIVLSLVCKCWRTVVLNTPSLWSTLVLSNKNPVKKIKKWVERSRGAIRELRIREGVLYDGKWTMDELNCLHWDALEICRVETLFFFTYLERNSLLHILSNLTELQASSTYDPIISNCILDKLSNAKLRCLDLDCVHFNWDTLSHRFTRLTSLAIRLSSFSSCKPLLATMSANPTLENLVVQFSGPPQFEVYSPFSLPLLTRLEFGGVGTDFSIFNRVCLPSLQILRFYHGSANDFWWAKSPQSCWAFLRELRLQSCYFNVSAIQDFLKTTPVLDTLEISHTARGANKVLEALATPLPHLVIDTSSSDLAVPSSLTFLCPQLAHVDFSHCPDIQTGSLLRLVKSRLAPETDTGGETGTLPLAQILSLVVDGCPGVEPSALPWLRAKVRRVSCVYMDKKAANWRR